MAKPKLDLIILDLADGADADQIEELGGLRVEAVHEGFAHEGARPPRRVERGVGLPGGHREGLLHQHVLARLGGLDRPFGVAADAASRYRRRRPPGRPGAPRGCAPARRGSARHRPPCPDRGRRARPGGRSPTGRRPPAKARAIVPGPMIPQRTCDAASTSPPPPAPASCPLRQATLQSGRFRHVQTAPLRSVRSQAGSKRPRSRVGERGRRLRLRRRRASGGST